jgi:hypothetical protein
MKKFAGYVLMGLAVLLGALSLAVIVPDIARRLLEGEAGGLIAIPIGIAIAAGMIYLLFRGGWVLLHPQQFSASAQLRQIYDQEHLDNHPYTGPDSEVDYRALSDKELIDVYHHINRQTVPARFNALLTAIKSRVEERQQRDRDIHEDSDTN